MKPWNKDLTKEKDMRLLEAGRKISLSKKGKTKNDTAYVKRHSEIMKTKTGRHNSFYGHSHSDETKKIIADKSRLLTTEWWKTPEYRNKCLMKLSKMVKKDTSIEKKIQSFLNDKNIEFKKDIVLLGRTIPDQFIGTKNLAIYEDGCRWHGCSECRKGRLYDSKKRESDSSITKALEKNGFTVLRFWEHEINTDFDTVADKILRTVNYYDIVRTA
ncbi:MAG: DUF559 domain-containing protein [Nitrospiria bacterium]